jgi:iron(III) transport system permease protein
VQTFTTGIYRAWFSLGDRIAAAQLAAALLASSSSCWPSSTRSRGRSRFHNTSGRRRPLAGQPLAGLARLGSPRPPAPAAEHRLSAAGYLLLRLALAEA